MERDNDKNVYFNNFNNANGISINNNMNPQFNQPPPNFPAVNPSIGLSNQYAPPSGPRSLGSQDNAVSAVATVPPPPTSSRFAANESLFENQTTTPRLPLTNNMNSKFQPFVPSSQLSPQINNNGMASSIPGQKFNNGTIAPLNIPPPPTISSITYPIAQGHPAALLTPLQSPQLNGHMGSGGNHKTPLQYALTKKDSSRHLYSGGNGNQSGVSSGQNTPNRSHSAEFSGFGSNPNSPRRTSGRIDPNQMPRPGRAYTDITFTTRSSSVRKNPPSVNSIYKGIDNGNALPRFLRATLVAPPCSKELLLQAGIPFGMISTPFAEVENGEESVPMVDMTEGIPRCTRCNGYVNSSVAWLENGIKWKCNLCDMVNPVPEWYQCQLDGAGLRVDRMQRPELRLGSVDYLVNTSDYSVREPQEPIHVFAIDISNTAVHDGITMASLKSVQTCIEQLKAKQQNISEINSNDLANQNLQFSTNNNSNNNKSKIPPVQIKVGIITYDYQIQFYSVRMKALYDPVQISIVDSDDPIPPIPPSQWLHSLAISDGLAAIDMLIQKIPELIGSLHVNDDNYLSSHTMNAASPKSFHRAMLTKLSACPAAAIKVVQLALSSLGGRLYVMASTHSGVGFGKLTNLRNALVDNGNGIPICSEYNGLYGTIGELTLYSNAKQLAAASPTIAPIENILNTLNKNPNTANNAGRDLAKQYGVEEKELYDCYVALGADCAKSFLCVNIFACIGEIAVHDTKSYFDTSMLIEPVDATGGRLYLITGNMLTEENIMRLENQGSSFSPFLLVRLVHDLRSSCEGIVGSEAVMKIRTSIGMKLDTIYNSIGVVSTVRNEVEISGIDNKSTFTFTFKHEGTSLKDEDKMHVQMAILYTNNLRQRVVRVHNMTMIATNKPAVMFRNSDVEAVTACLMMGSIERAYLNPLSLVVPGTSSVDAAFSSTDNGPRTYLNASVINMLLKYRIHCSANSPRGQLILPESLKILPLYTLGVLKHPTLLENSGYNTSTSMGANTGGLTSLYNNAGLSVQHNQSVNSTSHRALSVRANERAFELKKLSNVPLKEVINAIYPKLYPLLSLFDSTRGGLRIKRSGNSNRDLHNTNGYDSPGSGSGPGGGNDEDHYVEVDSLPLRQRNKLKCLCSLTPSSEIFDSNEIYLLDDQTTLYLYVGRGVTQRQMEEVLDISPNSYNRPQHIEFNNNSEIGNNITSFVELLRDNSTHKQELQVIWADMGNNPLVNKFSDRLVED
eukprot:gene13994-18767_t